MGLEAKLRPDLPSWVHSGSPLRGDALLRLARESARRVDSYEPQKAAHVTAPGSQHEYEP